jgi:hypothetical protein
MRFALNEVEFNSASKVAVLLSLPNCLAPFIGENRAQMRIAFIGLSVGAGKWV